MVLKLIEQACQMKLKKHMYLYLMDQMKVSDIKLCQYLVCNIIQRQVLDLMIVIIFLENFTN